MILWQCRKSLLGLKKFSETNLTRCEPTADTSLSFFFSTGILTYGLQEGERSFQSTCLMNKLFHSVLFCVFLNVAHKNDNHEMTHLKKKLKRSLNVNNGETVCMA